MRRYLMDFQERTFTDLKNRDTQLTDSRKIQTVIGARRVGKTYLLFNKIRELEETGVKKEQMIYINLETPLLNDITNKEVKEIIELHWSLFPETMKQKIYLFIDEPQSIEKWELAVREIHDNYDCNIFITGSSSKLLSKEISTSLRGRAITTALLPLSFNEFLDFKEFQTNPEKLSTKTKAQLINYLEEYLRFGGYPEIVLEEDKNQKLRITKDYFDLTVYKDLVERHNLKNTRLIQWLINSLTNSVAKEVSINKLFLDLKSRGVRLGKNTLYEYFSILEDSFFIFLLRKFEYSHKKEGLTTPKVYLNDIGFMNLFSLEDYGRRLENTVFLELARQRNNNPLISINYWKSQDNKEVDFIVGKEGRVESAIQVSYSLSDSRTNEREMDSLLSCLNHFKLNEGTIITKDQEDKRIIRDKTIRITPIWKWLLK